MTRHPSARTLSPADPTPRPRPGRRPARLPARLRGEDGITTAEYAVGQAAGAGLAGVLYQLVTGGYGDQMLRRMFDHVMGMLGIG